VGPAEAWPFNGSGSRAGDAGTDGAGFPVQMVGGCTRYVAHFQTIFFGGLSTGSTGLSKKELIGF